jgi:hypothetical protein
MIETTGTASQPCAEPVEPPPSPTKSREPGGRRMGLFQTSSKTEATGAFLWLGGENVAVANETG